MNSPKFSEYDYMTFLTASPKIFTCTEVERVLQEQKNAPAHDAVNRLLHRLTPSASVLRNEAIQHVILKKGVLVLDDSTLDKLYAQHIELVSRHWSGKHHAIVKGINLITLLWTDGDRIIPCDYRIYNKEQDGKTKNDHFSDMLLKAKIQGFEPSCVLFDSWYSGLENLKTIRKYGWYWLTRLKSNRLVNPDGKTNVPVSSVRTTETGKVVHLKGFGFIKLFGITSKDGTIEYWATSHLDMDDLKRLQLSEFSWKIEEYHRNLKQFCGVERSQVRAARAQRNHIGLAIRTFLRFSVCSFKTGLSCFELKYRIIRDAVRKYMEHPVWTFGATA